jgi:glycosyltransferase involved in cell wall biosynthesis
LGWTPTHWQRHLFPAEYRDEFLVLHDGVDTRRFAYSSWHGTVRGPRSIAGRVIPDETRVVSFVARSLDRVRGFDRFVRLANALCRARGDTLCVVVGDPVIRRGLDVDFHNRDYRAHLLAQEAPFDADRIWFLGPATPATVAEVLAASDLHVAPGLSYPVASSLLEAMAVGCVVLASDVAPHREVIAPGQDGLLADGADPDSLVRQALAVLKDRATHRSLGAAAARLVREKYAQDVCLPQLAERFAALAAAGRAKP